MNVALGDHPEELIERMKRLGVYGLAIPEPYGDDWPYVTEVEGYPGLVVHGPLLALQLLEIPRRHADRPVTSFGYRLAGPVFSGATVLIHGRREDGKLVLPGMAEGGARAITGRVTFAQ